MITSERLKQLLSYDPETGAFTWKVRKSQRVKAGTPAGAIGGRGYRYIEIDGKSYRACRLAVLHETGSWPCGVVDHKNNDHADDSWTNLRDLTQQENCQNRGRGRVVALSGVLGVGIDKGRYRATIKSADGRRLHLGCFESADEASTAYLAAKRQHHAGCTI